METIKNAVNSIKSNNFEEIYLLDRSILNIPEFKLADNDIQKILISHFEELLQIEEKYKPIIFKNISADWKRLLDNKQLYIILKYINVQTMAPAIENIFEFAKLTRVDSIKIIIVGQDPYPKSGDAHGLAFSCLTGIPASLRNIYTCLLNHKLIKKMPTTGNLERWAMQGILLLNRSLTTVTGSSNAHRNLWEAYTDRLISKLSKMRENLIFMLWGKDAQTLVPYISDKSVIMQWSHPSPLAGNKFLQCPHFTEANKLLKSKKISWSPVEEHVNAIEKHLNITQDDIIVFTDGSCFPNDSSVNSIGGYAATFTTGPLKDHNLYGNLDTKIAPATNQRAEGMAIFKVLEKISEHDTWNKCVIITDSEFWINMFENYMPKWAEKDIFNEKKNPDLTIPMWNLYSNLILENNKTIVFKHIKSHGKTGWDKYPIGSYEYFCYVNNNYVDELATYARTELKKGDNVFDTAEYDESANKSEELT